MDSSTKSCIYKINTIEPNFNSIDRRKNKSHTHTWKHFFKYLFHTTKEMSCRFQMRVSNGRIFIFGLIIINKQGKNDDTTYPVSMWNSYHSVIHKHIKNNPYVISEHPWTLKQDSMTLYNVMWVTLFQSKHLESWLHNLLITINCWQRQVSFSS